MLTAIALILFSSTLVVSGQRRAKLGKVCGNPNLPCKVRENFQPFELPFDTGKNFVIAESEYFYAIVLQSVKLKNEVGCENIFPEEGRLATQELFPNNKVFTLKCFETGQNYYTNVVQDVFFLAVYAGKTLAEANKFLKTIQSTKKYPGIKVRKMQIGINGT